MNKEEECWSCRECQTDSKYYSINPPLPKNWTNTTQYGLICSECSKRRHIESNKGELCQKNKNY